MERRRPPQIALLKQKSPLSVGAQLAIRFLLLLALLAVIILVHWIERDAFVDNVDGEMSFADVIYFTMISATTTGYGDIVPVTERARLFDALVVTPARIFFILILAGTAYSFVIKRSWDKWIMRRLQRTLEDHIVVAGFGTSGSEAVHELVARGEDPRKIVVIDQNTESLAKAERMGCIIMQADATRDETLEAVRIRQAATMIISAGRDDTSILICLTARHLCPDLPISLAVRAEDNEFPARAAGATTVINPVSFAGLLLAGSAHGAGISDYLADLASATGRVRLHERVIENFEVGKSLAEVAVGLGVRILRDGKPIGFWQDGAKKLEAGDRIIEIIPGHAFPPCPPA
ncbi:potassium channel family protein [Sphingomicrobium clamense]|uniref:Potassium channel family protein n=1 Tax=Sphingomicrobium clamense TaxID=2851013 RepID=A0ABS6V5I7_9SPHN|nr:potassium channel family protein [Sphingomicrobium sp. B8]MBW0144789.1 potassium channel family protein [Sphingomicrobium sp. B8]